LNIKTTFLHVGYVLLALIVLFSSTNANAQSRLPITVANSSGGALTNHSVRIELNATNAPGFDFTNNGDDLIAWNSDTSAMLDFFVEEVDSVGQTAVIWIEVPSVPISPPDTTVFLDYNRTDVTTPLSNAADTFPTNGFKYHTQEYTGATPGPESRAEGEAAFDFDSVAAPGSGYGCSAIANYSDGTTTVDNSTVYGSNNNIGFFMETMIVVPADARYEFLFGGDFGHGGELYLDGTTLEADWTNDLWWAGNGNPATNGAELLLGDRLLTEGAHSLKLLGFERCCDGFAGLQYRYDSDGDGSLTDETFSNLTASSPGLSLFAPSCPVTTTSVGPVTTVPVTLSKFTSFKAGPFLKLSWETADESFNAGFDIWTLSRENGEPGELVQLNRRLLRSKRFDSMQTQRYSHRITLRQDIDNVVISSVDINGTQEFFGPFEPGQTYGDEFESQPINWQKVHAEHTALMRARGFVRVNNRWRKARRKGPNENAFAHITVAKNGVHRVTYSDLLAAGIDWRGVARREIAVTRDGRSVPRRIGGHRSRVFGPGSYIDFVGTTAQGSDRIYQTDGRYQVVRDAYKALPVRWNRRVVQNPQSWSYQSQTVERNSVYSIANPGDTPWLMDVMFRTSRPLSRQYEVLVANSVVLKNDVPAKLEVDISGVTNLPFQDIDGDGNFDPDHKVEIRVNGELVKVVQFEGQITQNQTLDLRPGLVVKGANNIEVTVADSGYWFDAIGVDRVKLSYPVEGQNIESEHGESEYDGYAFRTNKRRAQLAYVYRDDGNLMPARIRRIKGKRGWYSVPYAAQSNAKLFVGTSAQLHKPAQIDRLEAATPISLYDTDLLIVTHPSFAGEVLDTYVRERQQQGVAAQVITTSAIAENYGLDVPLHIAIKRFLKAASAQIDFNSVLLVGSHSYDYNHYLSNESVNFIPTFYRPIGYSRFTPSDQPFVDFDDDGYPEKQVGRWPVRTLDNLAVITKKSVLWADTSDERSLRGHQVLALADRVTNLPFTDDMERQLSLLEKTNIKVKGVTEIYLDELKSDATITNDNFNLTAQTRVQEAIEAQSSWVLYNGHGSPSTWSSTNLLKSESIAGIDNHQSPLMITSMGCYTTYYESPSHNSLAHQLLFSGSNGAAAIHGPAVVGGYHSQRVLADSIMRRSGDQASIGRAIFDGMRALPINHRNAILNWALLADPTLPMQ